ncbi:hypothetical protein F5877DRAFT_64835 [Lentinula edodes]|nr:hypothetical protein F5877DRAFT_64835 [Lentinula edodes]
MFIDLTNGNAWNERTYKQYFIRAYANVMRLPGTGISNVLVSVRKRSPLRDLQRDAYWMNDEAFLLTVDENAKNNGFSNSGDGDGGREEGSQAASRWSSTHRSLLTSFVAHLAESGQNSAPGGVKRKAAKILSPRFPNEKVWLSRLQPYLETKLSLENIPRKYVFVAMHDDSKRHSQTWVTSPYQLLRTLYYHGTPSKEHTNEPN